MGKGDFDYRKYVRSTIYCGKGKGTGKDDMASDVGQGTAKDDMASSDVRAKIYWAKTTTTGARARAITRWARAIK